MSTSFVQFQRCDLCRINHTQGIKHVYTKRHTEIIKTILRKYGKKISEAKKNLQKPIAHDPGWENGAKFWCYFCREEIEKHIKMDVACVQDVGLLQHIMSEEHKKQIPLFWKHNRIKNTWAKRNSYMLSPEEFTTFQELAVKAVRLYAEEQDVRLKKEAEKIRRRDASRQYMHHFYQQMPRQRLHPGARPGVMTTAATPARPGVMTTAATPDPNVGRVHTVAAHGPGLTCIKIKAFDDRTGNVYTGAVPPWLRKETDTDQQKASTMAGPSEEDYKKHLERERKRKLPAERVGANFDPKEPTNAGWLPQFGRVWSKNRRSFARSHFMKRASEEAFLAKHTVTSDDLPHDQEDPTPSSTVTSSSDFLGVSPSMTNPKTEFLGVTKSRNNFQGNPYSIQSGARTKYSYQNLDQSVFAPNPDSSRLHLPEQVSYASHSITSSVIDIPVAPRFDTTPLSGGSRALGIDGSRSDFVPGTDAVNTDQIHKMPPSTGGYKRKKSNKPPNFERITISENLL